KGASRCESSVLRQCMGISFLAGSVGGGERTSLNNNRIDIAVAQTERVVARVVAGQGSGDELPGRVASGRADLLLAAQQQAFSQPQVRARIEQLKIGEPE